MEPASEQALVLAPTAAALADGRPGWTMVGRGWREPVTRLVQLDPALASRITVVTDPEDPDLDHARRLRVRVQVRPEVVRRVTQQVCGLTDANAPDAFTTADDGGYAAAIPPEAMGARRASAIEATRRLLLARGLSRREAEVAAIAAEGDDTATIAAELFLSPNTVKRHLGSAYRKLGVRHRAGLLSLIHAALPV